jgi:hypothetical protein
MRRLLPREAEGPKLSWPSWWWKSVYGRLALAWRNRSWAGALRWGSVFFIHHPAVLPMKLVTHLDFTDDGQTSFVKRIESKVLTNCRQEKNNFAHVKVFVKLSYQWNRRETD